MAQDRNQTAKNASTDAANAAGCDAGAEALAETSEPSSGNATAPTPAIAPGAEDIDARRAAEEIAAAGMDPRIAALAPAFDAPFFQAGLAGYSDAAMRLIARRHGCPFCVTEALLDRTLLAGGRGFAKADLGELHDNVPGGGEDHPLACQIMGSDPREMSAAAVKVAEQGRRGEKAYRLLAYEVQGVLPTTHAADRMHLRLPGGEQLGRIDPTEGLGDDDACADSCADDSCETLIDEINAVGDEVSSDAAHAATTNGDASLRFEVIDINLACPVKKISKKARGGHWLAEPEGAIRILEAVREAVPSHVPCSVKLRRSFDDTPEMVANIHRILDAARRIGYAWATVHARTVEQKYIGPSRWDLLRDLVARHRDLPIFGSGDIWSAADIFRMMKYTGVVGASVARGCIGNPWIFRQARDMMAGRAPAAPTIPQQREVLREHFRLLLAVNSGMRHGEDATSKMMRKFGIRFAAHHPRADDVRKRFIAVRSTADWERVLEEMY
ncbi:MAG: tRNA-dihydrouridine synthase family protein [Planctomycetota bacterium]|nr:tRNA-dihydrouridine synthase family protein [Planctomycetota bacterium]